MYLLVYLLYASMEGRTPQEGLNQLALWSQSASTHIVGALEPTSINQSQLILTGC